MIDTCEASRSLLKGLISTEPLTYASGRRGRLYVFQSPARIPMRAKTPGSPRFNSPAWRIPAEPRWNADISDEKANVQFAVTAMC